MTYFKNVNEEVNFQQKIAKKKKVHFQTQVSYITQLGIDLGTFSRYVVEVNISTLILNVSCLRQKSILVADSSATNALIHLLGKGHLVSQDMRHFSCNLGAGAALELYATGRRPRVPPQEVPATYTAEAYGKGPCIVCHRRVNLKRRWLRRDMKVPPLATYDRTAERPVRHYSEQR